MTDNEVIQGINSGLGRLINNDIWLLQNDLSEQSIAHKLAEHIQDLFGDYNVDCEYNGAIARPGGKKNINMVKAHLGALGLLREAEENALDQQLVERGAFPDIIIHKRATNEFNLCVIELKKSTSNVPFEYDKLKLEAYTTGLIGNELQYQLGIFIEVKIDEENPAFELLFFKNGEQVNI